MTARPGVWYTRHPIPLPQLNVIRRSRAPLAQVPALIAELREAHQGSNSRWSVQGRRPGLERLLEAAGYAPFSDTHLMAAEVSALPVRPADARVRPARRTEDLLAWAAVYTLTRRISRFPEDRPWHLLLSEPCVHRVMIVEEEGRVVAAGALQVCAATRAGLLWGAGTLEHARDRGVYRALLDARLNEARRLGLRWVGAFARPESTGLVFSRMGFETGPRVMEWERQADAP